MERIMRVIWLDDERNPFDQNWNLFIGLKVQRTDNVHIEWIKTYEKFYEAIQHNPLPDAVFFDHDLGEDEKGNILNSGYDAAKYLFDHCLFNNLDLPNIYVQSANPVGANNIERLFASFNRAKEIYNS